AFADYDGLVWLDNTLDFGSAGTLQQVSATIPLTLDGDVFLNYSTRIHDNQVTTNGVVTDGVFNADHIAWSEKLLDGVPVNLELTAMLSVVNDFRGLAIYLPVDPSTLNLVDYDGYITVLKSGTNINVTVNLSTNSRALAGSELDFTLGFQPVPSRTYNTQANTDYRIYKGSNSGHDLPYTMDKVRATIDTGDTWIMAFQNWTEYQSYYTSYEYADQMKASKEALHSENKKIVPYFGFEISDVCPEAELYLKTVSSRDSGGYIRENFGQQAWPVCYASQWGDHWLQGMLDEFLNHSYHASDKIDGMYMDGTLGLYFCLNEHHDHAKFDQAGRQVPYFPVLETRRFSQILHQYTRGYKSDFLQFAHTSHPFIPATMGFVDVVLNGEHTKPILGHWKVPLDVFRAQFNSRQCGVPVQLLNYEMATEYRKHYAALMLFDQVHTPWTITRNADLLFVEQIWGIMDDYGLDGDKFVPFYSPDAEIHDDNGNALVSYYATPTHFVVVVSNYEGTSPASALVDLSHFSGQILGSATELLDAQDYSISSDRFAVSVGAEDFKLFAISRRDPGPNTTNILNYVETFEPYSAGFTMPGTNGWSAAEASDATVITNAVSVAALAAYSEPCGYPVAAAHAKVLEVDGTVTNSFAMDTNQVVWVDQMVQAYRLDAADPGLLGNAQAAFYFNSNGHPMVWHRDLAGATNRWTEIPEVTATNGQWTRLTFKLDYQTVDPINNVEYFQVRIDGVSLTNALAKTANDGSGSEGGRWFAMPGEPDRMSRLIVDGAGSDIDDLVVGTDSTLQLDVEIAAGHGVAIPPSGMNGYEYGDSIILSITNTTAVDGGAQYEFVGWSMTGHSPASGTGTTVAITLTNDLTLTWLWSTNAFFLDTEADPGGAVSPGDGWHVPGTNVTLVPLPDAGKIFDVWSGDVPGGQENDNPLTVAMDQPRTITANFVTNTANTVPYAETFEPYAAGFGMPGTNGWSAAEADDGEVGTNAASVAALNAYSAACGYPTNAIHAKVLEVAGTLTNSFTMDANQILWVDQMAQARRISSPFTNLLGNAQAALYFNTNGHPMVWHRDLAGGTNRWTEISEVATEGNQWVRLTFNLDYQTVDAINHVKYFQVRIDGFPLTNALAQTVNDGSGSEGGSWFAMSSEPDRMSRLVFAGYGGGDVDDLVVTSDNPMVAPMGTPFDWLVLHGLTNGTYAEEELLDSDGDGVLSWQEWVGDTVPADSNSLLQITNIVVGGAGAEVFWQGGVQATQWLERCTNLVEGGWDAVLTNEPPTSPTESFIDSGATNPAGFYRIKVQR
ncbi:MAG: hypothetical protein ABFR47_07765, partial [Verrucomicrobiota bacterium]